MNLFDVYPLFDVNITKGKGCKVWDDKGVELGYWIGEEYWGQGLVAEACKPIIKHLFEDLKINEEKDNK